MIFPAFTTLLLLSASVLASPVIKRDYAALSTDLDKLATSVKKLNSDLAVFPANNSNIFQHLGLDLDANDLNTILTYVQ